MNSCVSCTNPVCYLSSGKPTHSSQTSLPHFQRSYILSPTLNFNFLLVICQYLYYSLQKVVNLSFFGSYNGVLECYHGTQPDIVCMKMREVNWILDMMKTWVKNQTGWCCGETLSSDLICYHSSAEVSQGQIHKHGLAHSLEVSAFALCCPREAINTMSLGCFSVNAHTRR